MLKKILGILICAYGLTGCHQNTSEIAQARKELVNQSLANMVPVQGGEFLMGDFGPLVGEKLRFSSEQDSKVLHKVILSDFAISKYKVTNKEYRQYLKITGKEPPPKNPLTMDHPIILKDDYSVSLIWQRAKDYCLWLGQMSGKNIDLPTEAQWEYAARSRGQFLPVATNNGKFEPGKNIPNQEELKKYTDGYPSPLYPIGKYPPNPLGLYDMGLSGAEWTNDWYAKDYYAYSSIKDPKGPDKGTKKVSRGNVDSQDFQTVLTIFRQENFPIPNGIERYKKFGIGSWYVFRCAMNP